jgi:hypothetical protein
MEVLTFVDVLRVQDFVFATNRLRDVVAGSELVEEASGEEVITKLKGKGDLTFAAGGNALLRFESDMDARSFAARYSRWLIENAPGLEVEVVHIPFENGGWREAFTEAQKRMMLAKLSRWPSAPVLGLSVTAECAESRVVATHRWRRPERPNEQPISAAVAMRRLRQPAHARWRRILSSPRIGKFEVDFPLDLDKLGCSRGDTSLIGVVHVDGNGVGRKLTDWLAKQHNVGDDDLRRRQGGLSRDLRQVAEAGLYAVVRRVEEAVVEVMHPSGRPGLELRSRRLQEGFPLATEGNVAYLPFRPVLVGGDDLTFLCDGRIALDLASEALEAIRSKSIPELGQIGACAGIAIVRSHAPFSRAYQLAEALCRNAKGWLRERADRGDYALDWHIGHMTPLEQLGAMRQRELQVDGHKLTMRPYRLGSNASDRPSFRWLDETLLGPNQADGGAGAFRNHFWQQRRNKVKELRQIARGGPAELTRAMSAWKVTAAVDALPTGDADRSYAGDQTALLDAIELLDLFMPLGKELA